MNIDSKQLAAFAAVVREGSFEAAARVLNVTPSAVSQRIKQLEERLGRVLVQRGAPCVATQAGQALHRHAQQLALLEVQALSSFGIGEARGNAQSSFAIAVNADSMATWFMAALSEVQKTHIVTFDLVVEDQAHSSELLRLGKVLAAVTEQPQAVQGCRVEKLGSMRYRAVASPDFMTRYFSEGVSDSTLSTAPCNIFNRKDALQTQFVRKLTRRRIQMPGHFVPSTHGFVQAALTGLGWGMNPEALVSDLIEHGELIELVPGVVLDVPLYWQHWRLDSDVLNALTAAAKTAAKHMNGVQRSALTARRR
jgi:LysR family transcriptional regulator, chromosome initiation inhibitor